MTVLAVLDRGSPASSDEVISVARHVGTVTGSPVEAVAVPEGVLPAVAADGLATLLDGGPPAAVLAPSTERSTEVMAHLAARAGVPLAANCVTLELNGGSGWLVTRMRGGGVLLEEAELVAPTKLVTLAPGARVAGEQTPSTADEVPVRELPAGSDDGRLSLVERATAGSGVTLATAPVVISGGRGIGSAEGFAVLEDLAELLGGAVGCSRVATNNGWRPHSDQVGQTGTKVTPKVYIAAGISGATQHWAGCMGSKTILAINTDAEAPMVTRAHYAVIGDAQEVLRAVTDEIRRRHSR